MLTLRLVASTAVALVGLSACSAPEEEAKEAPPEATVEAFYAETWDEGETADEYLEEISPYLTPAAIEASREAFGQRLDGKTTIAYDGVEIETVELVDESTATVTVSYSVSYSFEEKAEEEKQTSTIGVEKIDGKWLLAE